MFIKKKVREKQGFSTDNWFKRFAGFLLMVK